VLEQARVVERREYQQSPPRFDYHLTDSGRSLIPVLESLLAWGREYAVDADDPLRRLSDRPSRTIEENA